MNTYSHDTRENKMSTTYHATNENNETVSFELDTSFFDDAQFERDRKEAMSRFLFYGDGYVPVKPTVFYKEAAIQAHRLIGGKFLEIQADVDGLASEIYAVEGHPFRRRPRPFDRISMGVMGRALLGERYSRDYGLCNCAA